MQPQPKSKTVWIVLGIVGGGLVLLVVALMMQSSSTKYRKTRRDEASQNLDRIKKAAQAYYGENAAFPIEEGPRTPADPCCDSGRSDRKCEASFAQWEVAPWSDLAFSVDDPHFYQYQYVPDADGRGFTAYAIGDLDCDDFEMTYVLEGRVSPEGNPRVELIKPRRAD